MRSEAMGQAFSRISAIQADLHSRIAQLTPQRTAFSELLSQKLSGGEEEAVRFVRVMPENLSIMQAPPLEATASTTSAQTAALPGSLSQRMAQYDPLVQQAANKYNLSPALVHAVIRAESSYNPGAVSNVGAQGLMQLMPGTAKMLGVANSFDPAQNIDGGCAYLRQMLDLYNGDERLALAAYNCGPGKVSQLGVSTSYDVMAYARLSEGVRGYVDTVQRYKNALA